MQYALLIYEDERVYGPEKQGEAMNQVMAGHMALSQKLGDKRIAGAGLQNTPTATTVRTAPNGSKSVHDGPFAETKEQLGGFYVIEADDLDEAIAMAKQVPIVRQGTVEIRPVIERGQRKAS